MESTKPNIEVKPSTNNKIIGYLSTIILGCIWAYIGYIYPSLPETIPTHFDARGVADAWSDKISIIGPPLILTLVSAALWYGRQFYRYFNYPKRLTAENAQDHYRSGITLFTNLRLSISIICAIAIFSIVRCQTECPPQSWILAIVLGVVILPIALTFFSTKKSVVSTH
jgi:uncharacterized membrane protein